MTDHRAARAIRSSNLGSAIALAIAVGSCRTAPEPAPAAPVHAIVIKNARVWGEPEAEALIIEGDRILAVGPRLDLKGWAPTGSQVIDAKGGWVLPGFHDAHIHMMSGGMSLVHLDLNGLSTVDEVKAALTRYAAENPEAPWIVGRGWDYGIVPKGSFPTAASLDAVVSDRPVYLESYDGHAGWANGKALAQAGVNASSKDPSDGTIVRNAAGAPEGTLLESAMLLVEKKIPAPTHDEKLAALAAAVEHCRSLGVTSVDDITSDASTFELYAELAAQDRLPIRVRVSLPLDGDLELYKALRDKYDSPWLSFGYLKGFVDGVIESKTAFMLSPYEGSDTEGKPLIPPDRLHTLVRAAHEAGFPVALHAIGDAAVRLSLDTFQKVQTEIPGTGLHHRIEHIEVVDRLDLPRFAELGVVASMQPYHAVPSDSPDEGVWSQNLGEDRRQRSFAWREVLNDGATLAFGSDWPVMSADPLAGLAVAMTRRNSRGLPEAGWNAQQVITAAEAVGAYSGAAVDALSRGESIGRLVAGYLADLVILSPEVDPNQPATLWTKDGVRVVVVGGRVR